MKRIVHVFGWMAIILIGAPAIGQIEPGEALGQLKVADGLASTLFAAEPDVLNPTAIDVDAAGRVWVCEAVNYRIFQNPVARPEGDRIRVLEDTNGDGQCDKATTFYQDPSLQAPLGIAVLGKRVYVCQSPDLFYLEDTDGDGKADKRTVVLTGFKGKDHDHAIHGVMFGPDGKLYMSNGDEGLDVTDKSGNRIHVGRNAPHGAASVLRTDLEGNKLELLAEGLRNPLEPAVDSFGNVFISDNDDDGNQQCRICYIMDGGNYGYWPKRKGDRRLDSIHWNEDRPGIVPKILKTGFGSPVGLTFYEGTLLPQGMRRTLLHADAGPGEVRSYPTTPKGAGFSAEINVVLSCPDDKWFRPIDVCTAPDGSVFVADWYDPGVGGHNLRDWTRGRIYRLAPPDTKYSVLQDAMLSAGEAIDALRSPNQARRFNGFQALKADPSEQATEYLLKLTKSDDEVMRARALWLLWDRGRKGRKAVLKAMREENPAFRVQFVRIMAGMGAEDLRRAEKLLKDSDSGVRRELLLSLQHIKEDWAEKWIVILARQFDGKDRFYREAIGIASRGREEKVFAEIVKAFDGKWNRAVSEIAFDLNVKESLEKSAQILADASAPMETRLAAVKVVSYGPAEKAAPIFMGLLNEQTPKELVEAVLAAITADGDELWSAVKEKPEFREFLRRAIKNRDHRPAALAMIRDARIMDMVPDALAVAQNASEEKEDRLKAMRAIGAMQTIFALEGLKGLTHDPDPEIASEAVKAVGSIKGDDTLQILEGVLGDAALTRDVRRTAVQSLGTSKSGTLLILKIAEEGRLAQDLTLDASTVTHASPFEDVRLMADQILPAAQTKEGKALPPISELVKMKGEAPRGREAFFTTEGPQCFKCHKINGEGKDVGPDLSKIGSKLAREAIYESILNPSAAISHEYQVWIIRSKSKGYLNGYIRAETPDGMELMDSNGEITKLPASDVLEKRKSAISLMPTGLSAGLTTQQLTDLTEFLATLK